MNLDIMTLLVMNVIVNVVGVWAMTVIWVQNRDRYAGLGFWLANMACQSAGLALVLMKGLVPDLLCIVLANVLLLSGPVFLQAGMERFVSVPSRAWPNVLLLGLFALALVHTGVVQPWMQARQVLVSAMIIVFMGQTCWLVFHRAHARFRAMTRLAGYVLLGFIAVSVLRIAMTMAHPLHTNDFFRSGLADALAITLYTTLNTCLTICLVLVVNRRLVSDVHALKDELEVLATHDSLTGLPNRKLFHDRFQVAMANARRKGSGLAVMSLDLDHFKRVNDELGHPAGDDLLVQAAGRLTRQLRQTDTVARFGGDEFLLLVGDLAGEANASEIAAKIAAAFAEPFLLEGIGVHVPVSIGVALFPGDGEDAETLVRKSDQALYQAKLNGRGTFALCGRGT